MDLTKAAIAVAIMAAVTVFTRVFPFLFFRDKELPPVLMYIQKYTPPVIMTVLVIYCLQGIAWLKIPYGIPKTISILAVAALHLWKRNPLISIFGGTILYMALIQTDIVSRLLESLAG